MTSVVFKNAICTCTYSTSTYFNFPSYLKEIIYKTKVNLCCSALLADYCTIIVVDHYSF